MKVEDLMTRDVATVRPEDGLDRAARLMQERDCGCVAVVDEDARLAGVLTDRDVCMAALQADSPLSRLVVNTVMTTTVFFCRTGDSIAEAERKMGLHQVRRLPVLDEDQRLQGVLSLDDIAEEACREQDLILPPVSTAAVGRTLGQIGRPHLIAHLGAKGEPQP